MSLDPVASVVLTRDKPSLEVPFFVALVQLFGALRQALNLDEKFRLETTPAGPLIFGPYRDKTPAQLRNEGYLLFDVGEGELDQHGRKDRCCSLDLVRGRYDFVDANPFLEPLYRRVAENDISGERVSGDKFSLREALKGWNLLYPNQPVKVINLTALAIKCLFAWFKALTNTGAVVVEVMKDLRLISDPFAEEAIIAAVRNYVPDRAGMFVAEWEKAKVAIDTAWKQAKDDLKSSGTQQKVWVRTLNHPEIPGKVRIGSVYSDSIQTGPCARRKGYDLIIIRNSSGHVQIATRSVFLSGGARVSSSRDAEVFQLNLSPLAEALRRAEAGYRNVHLNGDDLRVVGYLGDGTQIPWYLPEFAIPNCLFNGTDGNKQVSPTRIPPGKLFQIVIETLPMCKLVRK